jgi:hypothetical protein
MECCCVHAFLMTSYETSESFAVTLTGPCEVWILVGHQGTYIVTLHWTTAGVFPFESKCILSATPICFE